LLVTAIVAMVKLVPLWIAAPPFLLSRQANNPEYLQRLRTVRVSVKQWMVCTLLVWGFVASVDLFQVSSRLLAAKGAGTVLILFAIRNFSAGPEMAFLVALFLFLAQWHLLNRIESIGEYVLNGVTGSN
jgi:hypothetical protein